jgi:hypothetical protein
MIPAGGGEGPDFTAGLNFLNNAFSWCAPADAWTCAPLKPVSKFAPAACRALRFDFNVTDRADYFDRMRVDFGAEANGTVAGAPLFDDPAAGKFVPAPGSPAVGRGTPVDVELPGGGRARMREAVPGRVDCGAFQAYGRVEVPALEALRDEIVAGITRTAAVRPKRAARKP